MGPRLFTETHLTPTVATWVGLHSYIMYPMPDQVKPVICNFWHSGTLIWCSALSVRVSGCQKLQMTGLNGLAQDAL